MSSRSTSLSVLLISSALVACSGGPRPGGDRPGAPASSAPRLADLILVGGDVRTMDPDRPRASAVAIAEGRVLAVGDDHHVRAHLGPDTRVVELGGRSVTPGLVDGHAHLHGLGAALESVSLRGAQSAEAAAAIVAAATEGRPAGEWITGRGWDQNLWTPKEFPHHQVLDAVANEHPVAVRRVDGHALWANAAAMRLAGITAETPAPAGGQILRGPGGAPTGVFVDSAMDLIERHLPAPTAEVRRRRILLGAAHAVERGLTGVHEMGIDDDTAAVYAELAAAGELPLRVYAYLSGDPETVAGLGSRAILVDDGDDYFALRAVKMYADGALGSRGAALLAPYADDPDNRGNWVTRPEDLARAARQAADAGWQLGIHAIGDAANRAVLDAYEAVVRDRPGTDLRFRIEHAQVIAPDDLPRLAELEVLAAMQPTHATSDMPWAEARVGPERIRGAYAWRRLLDSGATIVAGSDFPVEEVAPLLGLYAAVTRQDPAGNPPAGWFPDQRMTLEEAIGAFTVAPAYAAFVEDHRGMLRPGYVADLTVYDRVLAGDASLLETRIDMTIVGGRPVYERRD